MLLDVLKSFEWQNEPYEISFNDDGMSVICNQNTDFWLDKAKQIHKNNAHFFYSKKVGDFEIKACFETGEFEKFCQAGIMIKADANNVFKIALMSAKKEDSQIGSSLTISGFSDWAIFNLNNMGSNIYYKVVKKENHFFAYCSIDDITYSLVRQFSFANPLIDLQIGAYFASPTNKSYETSLKSIEIK